MAAEVTADGGDVGGAVESMELMARLRGVAMTGAAIARRSGSGAADCAARADGQPETTAARTSASMASRARRIVDSLGTARPKPAGSPPGREVVSPLGDGGERPCPGKHRARPDRQYRSEAVAHTPGLARIGDRG